jgi:hypothetical protein
MEALYAARVNRGMRRWRWSTALASALAAVALLRGVACTSFGEAAETPDASSSEDGASPSERVDAVAPSVECSGAELGRFATYTGKVNVHTIGDGGWVIDTDCTSGSDIDELVYCRKYWPATGRVMTPPLAPDNSMKPFQAAGCTGSYPHPGNVQVVCCP